VLKRIFGGHWSPLGGYLSESSLVHVLDVNDSYGNYLVPTQRLYDAINTHGMLSLSTVLLCYTFVYLKFLNVAIDLSNGKPRGLIRIELAD
jgi:hypothetical protein